MAYEIELKARLNDALSVKKKLNLLGKYRHAFEKYDSYWFPEHSESGVRLRREICIDSIGSKKQTIFVTFKKKEIACGIEINDEKEFTVADADLFEEMLEFLGLHKKIYKEKKGQVWDVDSISAEISHVTDLGWFAELEIIADTNDDKTVSAGRERLLSLLEQLDIPADSIESRPYSVLLALSKQEV